MSLDDVMENALNTKLVMDELSLLGDKLYICMECHQVTDYWKPGMVCQTCEAKGERQFEQGRGN